MATVQYLLIFSMTIFLIFHSASSQLPTYPATVITAFKSCLTSVVPPPVCDNDYPGAVTFNDPVYNGPVENQLIDKSTQEILLIKGFNSTIHYQNLTGTNAFRLVLIRLNCSQDGNVGTPILILPGILQSSRDWVSLPQDTSLPMMLCKAGWDVWLMEPRGTGPTLITPTSGNSASAWNFTVDTLAAVDMPTAVDYILSLSSCPKMVLAGLSMGSATEIAYVASSRTNQNKISAVLAIHPPVFWGNATNPFIRCAAEFLQTNPLLRNLNMPVIPEGSLPPLWSALTVLTGLTCSTQDFSGCSEFFNLFFGALEHPPLETNNVIFPVVTNKLPENTSWKVLIQFFTNLHTGKFAHFDYGATKNLVMYKSLTPPNYNLGTIDSTKVFLYCAACDSFITLKDCKKYIDAFPSGNKPTLTFVNNFNHIDATYSKDGYSYANNIIATLDAYRMCSPQPTIVP